MELRHLRTFQAVARGGSVTRAAAELHYAQSSVSEQVQALETELGGALFERAGRRLRLTAAGERLLGYVDQLLALLDEARAAVTETFDEPTGTATIGALDTLCAALLPAVLTDYRARHGRVAVTVRQGRTGELHEAVRGGDLDVCFTFGAPPTSAGVCCETVREETLVVVAPAGHRLAGTGQLTLDELRGEPFLVTERGCGFRDMFDRSLGSIAGQAPVIAAEVASIAALGGCVAAGMGLAILPALAVADRLARGEVAALPIEDARFHVPVTMSWAQRREDRPNVAALLTIARTILRVHERVEAGFPSTFSK
ncbi:LysR family transcriptional regulator [Frankia sp. AgKG'84/4]|uniref:LysR family transcriptional regulator n=1 Tax=Frankia sp. AgKG'84/4 TaxID=573490 RepID=UPI00200C0561|nr:LysR family transcriptional regulator [Frankia sp. AgKG'84/4]MCL9796391.1 LysR family transcriptional regulator [Frankia sp. AgKG'84/4]